MRTFSSMLALIIAVVLCVGVSSAQNKFIGEKKCAMCHKAKGNVVAKWEGSAHAKAFATLKTKEADEIAKKKGLKKPAAESPECLKCHVTGGGSAVGAVKEEGVTCEACHGAGSGFMTLHNKPENLEKAKAAGFNPGEKTEKACVVCHNSESPSFKGFKFAEMWAKIEHKKK